MVGSEEQKLEESRRAEEARAERERQTEQELIRGGEQVSAEYERHDRDKQRAEEEGALIRCEFCQNEEPPNNFETYDNCGNRCCYQCISIPSDYRYRSIDVLSPVSFGKLCPNCFRWKKEALEEEARQHNHAQAENEEENE